MNQVTIKTKIALLMLAMLGIMSNTAIITSIPQFENIFSDVNKIDLLARLMITLPSLIIAMSSPFLAHIIHKTSIVKSAAVGLFFFGLFGTAGLYLSDIYSLLLSRLFLGIAIAIIMIVSTTLIGTYFQHEARYKFMGLQNSFVSIGAVLFITSGGFLSDIGWRYPFALYFISIFMLYFVVKNIDEPQNIDECLEEIEISGNLLLVYFLGFMLMVIFYTLPTQMPFLIMNHLKASGALTGLIISDTMLFYALGALSFAILRKYFNYGNIYIIGFTALSIGFIIIGNITTITPFFLIAPIVGFGGGLLMTTTTSWMLDLAHHSDRTKASGYLTSAIFGGQFASPILFHPFVSFFGLQYFFVVLGVSIGIVIIALKIFKK
jgi:MFS family permease